MFKNVMFKNDQTIYCGLVAVGALSMCLSIGCSSEKRLTVDDEIALIDASKGRLILNDVTEITPEAALKLAEFEGGDLQLNGLTTISPEIAQALAKHKGWLFLNGLSTVSKEEASALAKHES